MELPKPPDDAELKNIVDKLANFVARNGPEFEQMTKQKQKDNPKFSFLFGGEYFNYYQYRVTTEQAIANKQKQQLSQQQQSLVQQAITPQSLPTVPWQPPGQQPGQQPMSQPPPQGLPQQPPPVIPQQPPPQGLPQQPPPTGIPQQPPPQGLPPQQPLQALTQQPLQQQLQNLQQQVAQHQVMMDQQIKQSEQNLAAQYQSLIQQQQIHIDEALIKVRDDELEQMSIECDVKMEDLHSIVQPIIDSCTKDAILNGKSWIFQHCASTEKHCDLIANYLQKRIVSPDAAFELRLHLIYLVNDLLHHCVRKNASELKTSLEKVVVPIFCTASTGIDEDKKQKLIKLLTLWDQNKYFEPSTIEQLKNPAAALSTYQANLITENAAIVGQITNETQQKYGALQKQHQDFSSHLSNQLQQLQQQVQSVQAQIQAAPPPVETLPPASVAVLPPNLPPASVAVLPPNLPPSTQIITSAPQQIIIPSEAPLPQVVDTPVIQQPVLNQGMPPLSSGPQVVHNEPQPLMQLNVTPTLSVAQQPLTSVPDNPQFGQPPLTFTGPPPGFGPGGPPPPGFGGPGQFSLPDFSKPPPGFPPAGPPPFPGPPPDIDLTPSVPYYELPAGLMAPLVKLEEHEYRPLDPKDIRLPPPMPPSERLLAAVEAFYSVPTHERPRDSEGWEKLGLYEFFKAKQSAKKQRDLERELRGRQHSRSRSRSPSRSPSRSRSRSRSPPRERFRDRQDDRRRSRSRSITRSPSPVRGRRRYNSRRSRSRSRSRSESPLPYQPSSRSPSPQRRRRVSRSPTPPLGVNLSDPGSMMTPGMMDSRLGMDNKGHQLLKKMGWGGRGLGASEQGIVDPISGGDVRDRQDMFKGIGMDLKDPFEQFRKSKSHGFIQRMKARDEERTKVQKNREKEKDAE